MHAVVLHGTPLVDDPKRVGKASYEMTPFVPAPNGTCRSPFAIRFVKVGGRSRRTRSKSSYRRRRRICMVRRNAR